MYWQPTYSRSVLEAVDVAKVLLSLHVLVAILAVGSITVAASMFPRYALQAAAPATGGSDERAAGVAGVLHRVCCGYAVAGLAVPLLGIATGAALGVLGDAWLIASLALTFVAAGILGLAILPGQKELLAPGAFVEGASAEGAARRLSMLTGIFNVIWAVVVVLMIVRPGSTTSA
jgi:hypothetical protein